MGNASIFARELGGSPGFGKTYLLQYQRVTDGQTDVQPISIMCFSIADARKNDAAPYKSIRLTVTMKTSDDDNDECNTNITMKQ